LANEIGAFGRAFRGCPQPYTDEKNKNDERFDFGKFHFICGFADLWIWLFGTVATFQKRLTANFLLLPPKSKTDLLVV
jgi:hypothetical protein